MTPSSTDWSQLVACRGFSDPTKIPEAIDRLFSVNLDERKMGYWGLDNHIVVQSDLQNSAPYAANAIVEIFLAGGTVSEQLFDILYELYAGHGFEILDVGEFAGERIDTLCKRAIERALPKLSECQRTPRWKSNETLTDLIEIITGETT